MQSGMPGIQNKRDERARNEIVSSGAIHIALLDRRERMLETMRTIRPPDGNVVIRSQSADPEADAVVKSGPDDPEYGRDWPRLKTARPRAGVRKNEG